MNEKTSSTDSFYLIDYSDTKRILTILKDLDNTKINEHILDSLVAKSKEHESLKQQDSVVFFDRLLLSMALKAKNFKYIAKGQSYLAYDFRTNNQLDSSYHYYNLAQKSFKTLKDSLQVGRKLLNMAKIQQRQAAYFESKETITEAFIYLDSIENPTYWAFALNELAHNFVDLEEYALAEDFYRKAINKDSSKLNQILYTNNLGNLFAKTNRQKESISLFQELIQKLPKEFNEEEKARLEHNLALNEWELNNKNPLPVFLTSLQIRKEKNDVWGLLSSYSSLLDYFLPKDILIAEKYADSLISISKTLKNPNAEIETISKFLKHNPKKYASMTIRYIKLKDSIDQTRQAFKNQFAYLKYLDEQEKTRLLALEAETAQKQAQLAKKEAQRVLLLSLLAIFIVGGGSYYFFLKQRHKKQTLGEIYNTEKKISKKIHDGLANDVYGVMTAVQHQNGKDNNLILDQLENIYERTRDISHDTRELLTGKAFAIELKDMLQGFSGNGTRVLIKGLEDISWEKLNEHKAVALHRTLKELLVNMKKHSGAGLVALNFKEEKKRLKVDYSDNGIGIKTGQKYGVGLQNTENRIRSVGGKFIFDGREGKGVKISLSFPL